jgi:hypothetical protein
MGSPKSAKVRSHENAETTAKKAALDARVAAADARAEAARAVSVAKAAAMSAPKAEAKRAAEAADASSRKQALAERFAATEARAAAARAQKQNRAAEMGGNRTAYKLSVEEVGNNNNANLQSGSSTLRGLLASARFFFFCARVPLGRGGRQGHQARCAVRRHRGPRRGRARAKDGACDSRCTLL